MTIQRPVLIKDILIETGLSPGITKQSLSKQELEKVLLLLVNQKNTIKKLKTEMSILLCKETKADERVERSPESNGF